MIKSMLLGMILSTSGAKARKSANLNKSQEIQKRTTFFREKLDAQSSFYLGNENLRAGGRIYVCEYVVE